MGMIGPSLRLPLTPLAAQYYTNDRRHGSGRHRDCERTSPRLPARSWRSSFESESRMRTLRKLRTVALAAAFVSLVGCETSLQK